MLAMVFPAGLEALHGLLVGIRDLGLALVSVDTDAIPHTASETGGV